MSFTLPTPTAAERNRLARLFAQIASDAGTRVMEVYESNFETRTKADYSPVSDADERAEEVILARLEQDLPGIPVLAEERASREGVGGQIWDAFILVDPVDGTKEFIQRKGDFTVNIALICGGYTVAGAVFAPARREMYRPKASPPSPRPRILMSGQKPSSPPARSPGRPPSAPR